MNRSSLVVAVSAIALVWAASPALAQGVQALRGGASFLTPVVGP